MADRLDDLERRLAAVEARVAGADAAQHAARVEPPGTFWALDRVRALAGDDGAVLITGTVPLPTGGRAEWQEGVGARDLLEDSWEPTAEVLAALGHPVRLRLLQAVLSGTTTAAELTALPGVGTTGQTYHHLRRLVAAGWLRPATGAARGAHEVPLPRVVPLLAVLAMCRR